MIKIALAADHAGFTLKAHILEYLQGKNHTVIDFGVTSETRVDYPDFAAKVALAVANQECDKGILICGTGIGMALTANRFQNVRAASLVDVYSASMARRHNDLNVLCLGARVVGFGLAEMLIDTFLQTNFENGRHAARVAKIHQYDCKP